MGLRDKDKIEWLTSRVIERLEQQSPLPGMEHLASKPRRAKSRLPTGSEILAMVREILDGEEPTQKEEIKPMTKPAIQVKPKTQPATSINLTENARRVLGKRYLEKDKQGEVIETPQEMRRR